MANQRGLEINMRLALGIKIRETARQLGLYPIQKDQEPGGEKRWKLLSPSPLPSRSCLQS